MEKGSFFSINMIPNVGEEVKQLEPFHVAAGNLKFATTLEISMAGFLFLLLFFFKLNIHLPYKAAILFLNIYPKYIKTFKQRFVSKCL